MSGFNLLCVFIVYIFFLIILLIDLVFEDLFVSKKALAFNLVCCLLWPLLVVVGLLCGIVICGLKSYTYIKRKQGES